ncbi:MAG: hypothetical protein ACREOO_04925 [bacterium]
MLLLFGAPFVFFFAPLPIFLLTRWVGKKSRLQALTHAALIAADYLILDVSITALAGQIQALLKPAFLLAHTAKIVAALLGGWSVKQELALA